ncbi:GNAT family N-acetyltransferase [Leifsonia sp. TF02-11]|uniref:GNAT family N-acetyltransferase n=1 Tax=Leifsonia sp. TF02-11 TaxID=2815212 RepID=UPI0027DDD572|nr:GNAT family N-acetyltransferase [Leifsonia sp. TF02-11]
MGRAHIPTELRTERLVLRPWRDDDAVFAFDLYSRWEVARFLGRTPAVMADPADAVRRVARLRALEDDLRAFSVVESASGEPVGTVMLQPIPASGPGPLRPSGDTEIGWHFHPDRGHGYATEAAGALVEAALVGLRRVVAVTYPDNTASQRVRERIGMRRLGRRLLQRVGNGGLSSRHAGREQLTEESVPQEAGKSSVTGGRGLGVANGGDAAARRAQLLR